MFIYNGVSASDSTYINPDYVNSVTIEGDKEGLPIYKMHKERKMYFKRSCRQADDGCILSDTFGNISWKLLPERSRIGTYEVLKASCHYRGRDYEAWYAPDIPISSGPYKFGGLPGLILEVRSTDKRLDFRFNGIEMSKNINYDMHRPQVGLDLNMSFKDFMNNERIFHRQLESNAKARGREMTISEMESIELVEYDD
jgi:GLPGLI family protein